MGFKSEWNIGVTGFRLSRRRCGSRLCIGFGYAWSKQFHRIHINLRHITPDTGLVIITTCADTTLHIKTVTFMHVFLNGFSKTSPKDKVMPFSTIRHLCAILSSVATFCRGKGKISYTNMVVQISNLRILTHISK